jgi:hypothetical protein
MTAQSSFPGPTTGRQIDPVLDSASSKPVISEIISRSLNLFIIVIIIYYFRESTEIFIVA